MKCFKSLNAQRVVLAFAILMVCELSFAKPRVVPLPYLPQAQIEMRVAYLVNGRLPRMNSDQLVVLLDATRDAVKEHFGVDLHFAPVVEIPIETVFKKITSKNRSIALKDTYDFKRGHGNPTRLAKAFADGFKSSGEPFADILQFSRPYIGDLKENNFKELGAALSKLQLERLEHWRKMTALDGGPAIDATPYNEFPMWLALGGVDLPFELVLTNQIIAGVEYVYPAAHAAVRGGYSNGITSYSKSSRFKTVSIWSTFAFTADDAWVTQMRDGEIYSPMDAAQLAGTSAAHEIGHQLFHFLHPFGQSACLMNPVPMFGYRAWAKKLSPKDCMIGSSPAMMPGAYKFQY